MNILKRLKLSFSIAFRGKQLVKNQTIDKEKTKPFESEYSYRLVQ